MMAVHDLLVASLACLPAPQLPSAATLETLLRPPQLVVQRNFLSPALVSALAAEVNEYPCARKFQAIGADDGDFVESVRGVISNALGGRHIHPECVTSRPSSKGKYVSAHVTAEMRSGDEVLAVYAALKADERVLWYL